MALSLDEAGQFLRKCTFFSATSDGTLTELASQARQINLGAGQTLFNKGDLGTAMYFVMEGCVRIHNGDVVITHLDAGQVFGEVAALSNELRTASVTAEMDTTLLMLEQESIYTTLASRPDAARSVIQALCRRESQIIYEKFERLVKARVLENELDIGQRIQRNFLPETVPSLPGWKLNGLLQPARKVAGDFYDFFMLPRFDCVGIVIGDVCDKGVGAALFMTLFRSLIRSNALHRFNAVERAEEAGLASVLQHAIGSTNRYIASTHGSSNMFSSVFFGLLVPETGQLCYINAGHEAPCILGRSGVREKLPPTGPVIGLFDGAKHAVGTAEIHPGEALFAYTDGVTDAKNVAGEQFSEERLLAYLDGNPYVGPTVLHEVLMHVEHFKGDADQFDDITMLSICREG